MDEISMFEFDWKYDGNYENLEGTYSYRGDCIFEEVGNIIHNGVYVIDHIEDDPAGGIFVTVKIRKMPRIREHRYIQCWYPSVDSFKDHWTIFRDEKLW